MTTPPNDPSDSWASLTQALDALLRNVETKSLIIHARSAISWAILNDPDRVIVALQDLSQQQLADLAQAAAQIVGMASSLVTGPSPEVEQTIEGTIVKFYGADPNATNPDE